MCAILKEIDSFNKYYTGQGKMLTRVLVPGLGTGVGGMDCFEALVR